MSEESVGKISLDLEVKSDLGKQISSVSNLIGKSLKESLNAGTKSMFNGIKNSSSDGVKSIDSNMKKLLMNMKTNLRKTMKSVFSSIKDINTTSIKLPKIEIEKPKAVNIPNANAQRGPPTKALDKEVLTTQVDGTIRELDIVNAKIDQQREKLERLRESFQNTFNQNTKNKINEQILKTEGSINSLIIKSDKLGFKLADLDARLGAVGATKAISGVENLTGSIGKAGQGSNAATSKIGKLSGALTTLGFGAKKVSNNISDTNGQLKMVIRSMITWGMIFPMIIRGISAMASGLLASLNTNEQFANSLAQIKSNLMIAFTPIYQAILPAINALMSALSIATQYIASFISAIFGKTFNQSKQATQGLIDAKEAMGAYGDSVKKTAKSLGGLMGFDEINTLKTKEDDTDSGSGGTGSKVPTLVPPSLDTSLVDGKMSELAEKVKKVFETIFRPLKNAWEKDGDSVIEAVSKSVSGTKDTFKNLYRVLETPPVQLFIENMGRIGLSLIKLALSIYNEFILPVVNWFISILPGAANGLNPILDAVRRFIDYLSSNGELIRVICSLILGVVVAFKALEIGLSVVKWIGGVSTALGILAANPIILVIAGIVALIAIFLSLYASSEKFRNIVNSIGDAIISFLTPAFEFLKEKAMDVWNNALVPFGKFLFDLWKTVLEPLVKVIGELLVMAFIAVMNIVKSLWESVLKPFVNFVIGTSIKAIQGIIEIYEAWRPAIQIIIDIILFLWNYVLKPFIGFIGGMFLGVFEGVFNTMGNQIDNLKRIFGGIIDFIVGIFTGNWKRAWQGVKDIFGGIMGGLGEVMKAPLNAVIGLINGALNGLNKISVDIPSWVPGVGGKNFGVNVPKIPFLARGGILDSPTLAMVGEQGKEAVVPLENNTQGLDLLANKILERMGGSAGNKEGSSSQPLQLILNLDGSKLAEVLIKNINKLNRSSGTNLIIG